MSILIACGGTAGHIFPGLALAEELNKEDNRPIVMVLSTHPRDREFLRKAERGSLKNLLYEEVGNIALPLKPCFRYFPFSTKLFCALIKSFMLVLKYKPKVVIGFGGYASFAPLVVAKLLGIPTLIHEQNLQPGKANRILSRSVDKIATSFKETDDFFPFKRTNNKIVNTGFPLSEHLLDAQSDTVLGRKKLSKKFTIAIVGGSQGAHRVNELAINCLAQMDNRALALIQIIHLTGKSDFGFVKRRYQSLNVDAITYDFFADLTSIYRVTDLLISRAGAGAIFEAANFGLPCILIPYSRTGHQKDNAAYLERLGAALVLDENTATSNDLKKIIELLIANRQLRQNMAERIRRLNTPRAGQMLKEQVFALANQG